MLSFCSLGVPQNEQNLGSGKEQPTDSPPPPYTGPVVSSTPVHAHGSYGVMNSSINVSVGSIQSHQSDADQASSRSSSLRSSSTAQ